MMAEVAVLWSYCLRVAPGMGVSLLFCSLLPQKLEVLRVMGYICIFVLLR